MELTYSQNGDYLIPDIQMDTQPLEQIGKYGMLRRSFLREHRKGTYNSLLLQSQLLPHLLEIDQAARAQIEQSVTEMAKAEGVTEELRARDQMEWVGRMNNIKHRAEEAAIANLIHS